MAFFLAVKSGGALQQLFSFFRTRGLNVESQELNGGNSVGPDGTVDLADGAGGWRVSSLSEPAPGSFQSTYSTVTFVAGSSFRVVNSGQNLLLLNDTTVPTVATGRLLQWDGSQNIYVDPPAALFAVITTGVDRVVTAAEAIAKWQTVMCTAGGEKITLPNGTLVPAGTRVSVKDRDGNAGGANITVDTSGGNIDGAASILLTVNFEARTFVADGAGNWSVV